MPHRLNLRPDRLFSQWPWTGQTGCGRVLHVLLLGWLILLGHKPGMAPAWQTLARGDANRPVESELPTESQESEASGEYLFAGQRGERTSSGERATVKLPPNDRTNHLSRGRGFLMAEGCFRSEHDLRNGTGAHLRC